MSPLRKELGLWSPPLLFVLLLSADFINLSSSLLLLDLTTPSLLTWASPLPPSAFAAPSSFKPAAGALTIQRVYSTWPSCQCSPCLAPSRSGSLVHCVLKQPECMYMKEAPDWGGPSLIPGFSKGTHSEQSLCRFLCWQLTPVCLFSAITLLNLPACRQAYTVTRWWWLINANR